VAAAAAVVAVREEGGVFSLGGHRDGSSARAPDQQVRSRVSRSRSPAFGGHSLFHRSSATRSQQDEGPHSRCVRGAGQSRCGATRPCSEGTDTRQSLGRAPPTSTTQPAPPRATAREHETHSAHAPSLPLAAELPAALTSPVCPLPPMFSRRLRHAPAPPHADQAQAAGGVLRQPHPGAPDRGTRRGARARGYLVVARVGRLAAPPPRLAPSPAHTSKPPPPPPPPLPHRWASRRSCWRSTTSPR
jgi:hypothetical protein